jgi:hypothetical protein
MMNANEKCQKLAYLDYLIASEHTPIHMRHILVAMRDYGISFFPIIQNSPHYDVEQFERVSAFVALIDDKTTCSTGPDHFDHAERVVLQRLIDRCCYVVIISSAVVVGLYEFMAEWTWRRQAGGLIIETRPEHEAQWEKRIRDFSPRIPLAISTPCPDEEKYGWSRSYNDDLTVRMFF